MPDQIIKCPKCGYSIPLTEAFTHQIEQQLRTSFEADARKKEAAHQQALEAKDKEMAAGIARERSRLAEQAKKQAEDSLAVELKDLRSQVAAQKQKLAAAGKQELELRQKQRAIEEREENLKLELQRTLDDERQKIRQEAIGKAAEEHQLKVREKDHQMAQLLKQIETLKKKAEQGSQEAQGEVMELELEDALRAAFRYDDIEPVAKGKTGGDVLQRVKTNTGQASGMILWESKRTRNWADAWIPKLKDDQRNAKADVAVIVTEVLPIGVQHIGQVDGVWTADFASFRGLAVALRHSLVEIAQARSALAGQSSKMEVLYNYLAGPDFRRRVEGIVEGFVAMRDDLEAEKRAMEKHWAKREKQIERVLKSTAGMYGDLQGIIGNALPAVKTLELPAGRE